MVTAVVAVVLGTTVAGSVAGAVVGSVISASSGAAGGAAGGSGAAQGGKFLALWNPLCLSSTMAFARHTTSFNPDDEHWITVLLAVLCMSVVEVPWLVWHSWFVFKNLYGEDGVRTMSFTETPIAKVLATRPTCKIFSLGKIKYQFCLFFEWLDWLSCFTFRLNFQGNWVDEGRATVGVYGPLFMKFSPASVYLAPSCTAHSSSSLP